jgi:hypothetical protein
VHVRYCPGSPGGTAVGCPVDAVAVASRKYYESTSIFTLTTLAWKGSTRAKVTCAAGGPAEDTRRQQPHLATHPPTCRC